MRLADVHVRLHCSKLSLLKLGADRADRLPLGRRLRHAHQQGIRKLVAFLIV